MRQRGLITSDPMARVEIPGGLFGPTRPPFDGPDVQSPKRRGRVPMAATSSAVASRPRGGGRQRIMELLRERPATVDELAASLGKLPHAISGRLTELAEEGLIERTGQERRTR